MVLLHIGIDDTDSKRGMCTTYVGAVAIRRLEQQGFKLKGYPKLIRLNPNWKMKTRGNCAIAFTLSVKRDQIPLVKEIVLKTVADLAELHVETTNPGVVFYQGNKITEEMKAFSKKVVQDVVTIGEAEELARMVGAEIHKFKLGRGIVGALAAIGNTLEDDWTFELITYRTPENRGKPRKIDPASVEEMDRKTYPRTFDNLDPSTGEIRITPHTPCPILYGIRGETPQAVKKASVIVRSLEPIEQTIVYKTNQGTDAHLRKVKIAEARPNWSVIVEGVVCQPPRTIPGGHVIFRLKDETGEIDCAAYEPTRQFRDQVRKLIVGDRLRVFGGIKEKPELPLTVNLEKFEVMDLAPIFRRENPTCPRCGKRMKSEGKNKGYSCKLCKTRAPASAVRMVKVERDISVGRFEVPPRARRHLAKPLIRELAAEKRR
ncbi:MAG: TiaS agmantine-binding domain-containing protein [Candidatus Hadarchaeum sp.]|uniref:TiaS agmantine-binding domain-containing protein n=1 Tax=Candidatus Hadarchaeum sp. TaxID=2883567 RepID=UPI003D0B5BE5